MMMLEVPGVEGQGSLVYIPKFNEVKKKKDDPPFHSMFVRLRSRRLGRLFFGRLFFGRRPPDEHRVPVYSQRRPRRAAAPRRIHRGVQPTDTHDLL